MQLWNWMGKYHFSSDIRNFISHITYYSLMLFIAHTFKVKCMSLQDEWSCTSLVRQNKCNIEIFLSPAVKFCMFWVFFYVCCFFFQKNSFRNNTTLSNSLDTVQINHFLRPDPGLNSNCLQRISADNKKMSLTGKELEIDFLISQPNTQIYA